MYWHMHGSRAWSPLVAEYIWGSQSNSPIDLNRGGSKSGGTAYCRSHQIWKVRESHITACQLLRFRPLCTGAYAQEPKPWELLAGYNLNEILQAHSHGSCIATAWLRFAMKSVFRTLIEPLQPLLNVSYTNWVTPLSCISIQ